MRVRLGSWVSVSVCVLLGALSLWSASALASGGGFALPDGRGWELVSPVDKHGGAIEAMSSSDGGLIQASEGGNAIAYVARGSVVADPAGNADPVLTQALSKRESGGWTTQDITAPHEAAVSVPQAPVFGMSDYKLFAPDLSVGLLEPQGDMPLPPLDAGAEKTIYLRDDTTGRYLPLVTAANVPPGKKFGGEEFKGDLLKFEGASPDLSHVVFSSPEALTTDTVRSIGGQRNIYEWSRGRLQLVSVLPSGKSVVEEGGAAELGWKDQLVRHAVSNNGSRVFWEAGSQEAGSHLYMRDMERHETIQIDVAQSGAQGIPSDEPVFQSASDDGSRVFFTDSEPLTADAKGGLPQLPATGDLYVFEISNEESSLSGALKDLTVDENVGDSANVLGVLPGSSEDGSYVYFVANGALAPGVVAGDCKREGQTCGLYMVHRSGVEWEKPKLVAVLSGEDWSNWARTQQAVGNELAVRVSPDGRYLTFMSNRSLTGYDNRDAVSGAPDEEVYVYDARSSRLVCASCDPLGAQPTGIFDFEGELLVDHLGTLDSHWLAGSIPAWTPVRSFGPTFYQSRFLSDEGRLFFTSPGALVPGDVNGKEDVYEYEPAGVGGCQSSTRSASVVYSAAAAGCVGLISSGVSGEESAFLDASATGGDVFFVTSAKLTPQDADGAFDVYDAHECTSESPCLAPTQEFGAPCGTAESCRGALSSSAVFGSPGSATFAGAGNVVPIAPNSAMKRRAPSRAQKLAQALKACRKKPHKQRLACEARTRKAYKTAKSTAGKAVPARAGR